MDEIKLKPCPFCGKEPTIAMVFDGIMHIIKDFAKQSDIPVETVLFNLMMYSKFHLGERKTDG